MKTINFSHSGYIIRYYAQKKNQLFGNKADLKFKYLRFFNQCILRFPLSRAG